MRGRIHMLFWILASVVVLLFAVDIAVGSQFIPFATLLDVLTGGGDDISRSIILKMRLPKALTALLAGAALAAAGVQMQTLFRNPLAGPYVLGISSGASLGVALFLLGLPLLGGMLPPSVKALGTAGAACVGAAAVMAAVMALSRRIKDIMVILILGMMIGSAAGAVVEIMQYMSSETALKSFVVWTMGSLGDVTPSRLRIVAPVIGAGIALSLLLVKPLNMLMLGENYARTMGLNVARTRGCILLSTTILAGTVTGFCGPIGFIGLAAPHIARALFADADHRVVLPASMLTGMVMLLLCDILSKMFALPVNTVSALMGIPVVVWVVVRNKSITV